MARPRKTNRHLPPCVYPRHSAFWYVKGGKWQRLGAILQDALSEYARLHETPKRGMPALIDTVLLHLKPKLKPSTANQYATAARKLKTVLQHFAPEQVKPKHMAAIKVALPATPNMGNRCLSFLRQIFDYALEQQLVESNPALGIKRHHEKKRARLISADECRAIYATAGPRLQVIMELLIRTRQRVTAVLRIHRTDLGDDGIRFPAHKTDAKRIVRWTFELPEVVARAKGLNGIIRSLTLLSNPAARRPTIAASRSNGGTACTAAGVPDAHLHDLRAVAFTATKRQGINPTALAAHSSPAMTERYPRDREEPVVDGPSYGFGQSKTKLDT